LALDALGRDAHPAPLDEVDHRVDLPRVEPDAVVLARVHDDAAHPREVRPVHVAAALWALEVGDGGLRDALTPGEREANRLPVGAHQLLDERAIDEEPA